MLLASAMFAIMGSFVKLGTEHGATLPQVRSEERRVGKECRL